MAFIQIRSTNPDMSYVLGKNPASGMLVRSIRKGKAFGYYSEDTTFNIFFKDSDTEVSYKSHENEEFEYVNKTRYNSAVVILNMVSEFFAKTVKVEEEHDKSGFINTFVINMLHISSPRILEIVNHIEGFDIEATEVARKNYKIVFTTTKSIRELLNFINVFCLYEAIKNSRDFVDLSGATIEKYLNCLEVIDPPYFVRYIFKRNILQSRGRFDKYKKLLENTTQHTSVKLTFGDTGYARRDWLKSMLGQADKDIVDIGCGEGFYVFDLARKLKDNTYHAIDVDEEMREIVENKAKKRKIENVKVYDNFDKIDSLEGKDALFMEVMEHMEYDEAVKMTEAIIAKNPERFFISTPNKNFNKFYFEENRFRHDDHKFELTEEEFRDFLRKLSADKYDVKMFPIGDSVDNIPTTLGAVLTREAK